MRAWVAAQGYPALSVLDIEPPGELFEFPVQVMQRWPGITMAEAMAAALHAGVAGSLRSA